MAGWIVLAGSCFSLPDLVNNPARWLVGAAALSAPSSSFSTARGSQQAGVALQQISHF